ncbi:Eukaryotic translation initiation factor 3 subunit E [Phytophthora cinnamomi]|uniref:Eukaryotic translation initiation factor 3 subunit E n=2 Tax=Phytophthora cinnamomi TaxID=4785 RepID=UPI00355A0628|nr:Eukaryotic translation initiation factor 3 subunit E [Phytophthora cinnamomi]
MGENFYTSDFSATDTSTTIIFNVYRGEPEALQMQLEAALNQNNVVPPDVWIMCFNSPKRHLYESVVETIRTKYPTRGHQLVFTASDFNHKFHGRFLLAYMATTKYVLIVDDDKAIDSTTVIDYIQYMQRQKGVWGNNGHRRAPTFEGYKSWPNVGYNLSTTDMEEQDYLCGMWFLEQSWLEYFMKERPPSWATSEDMHLSHVMRKYLNLNTYGGKVALEAPGLPGKEYAATKGSALDLREFIFDHQLGRGNKVANVDQPIESLVYAESVEDIEAFIAKLDACAAVGDEAKLDSATVSPWCNAGRTAAVFRGAKEQDVNGLIAAAEKLCAKTNCEYFSVKPKISHGIKYFNMREGFGQASTGVEIPFQTGASDVMLSLVGILNNVLPQTLFVPDVSSMRWPETDDAKRNRLQIYHRTVLLAVDIHRSSKTNGKWVHRGDDTDPFPTGMRTFVWQNEVATLYEA